MCNLLLSTDSEAEKRNLPSVYNATEGIVAFKAGRTSDFGPVPEDFTVTFDQVDYNTGGGFDAFSSHFFAVVPGVYLFTVNVRGANQAIAQIVREQQSVAYFKMYYGSASATVILDLDYLQSVWVVLNFSSDSKIQCHASGNECTFSGILLKERQPTKN